MPIMETLAKAGAPGVLVAQLPFTKEDGAFSRADLIFTGVDHHGLSYEVRAFLNNPEATAETPRDPERGYAGRYVVFGHGGCYGDEGHCELPPVAADPTDLRPPHPLTPQTKLITITKALRRVLTEEPTGLRTVTLVPVSKAPRQEDRGPLDTFVFGSVELQTYLADTEDEESDD